MPTLSRRSLLQCVLAGSLAAAPFMARAARPRVVVVGGGAGGAKAARALAMDEALDARVTLVEPSRSYHTCFFSNLYLGGFREYASISHGYAGLARLDRLNVAHEWVRDIDRAARRVFLGSGATLGYDRLVLAPGIDLDYDSVPGYSLAGADVAPHAWKSATQVQLLRAKALAMRPGGTFVLVAPPDPSRCPPGPYERVSMLAHVFRRHNPKAKIVILDPKEKYPKQALFHAAWQQHYGDMILWLPASISGGLVEVDLESLTFRTELEDFEADAASIVPAQRAGTIAQRAGLTDDTGWAPIRPRTLESTLDPHVHVIGDAAIAAAMPKSAFAANSQARVAARAVRDSLAGREPGDAGFANICWSLLAPDDAVKIGAVYRSGETRIESTSSYHSELEESREVRAATAREAERWYAGIVRDTFG